MRINFNIMLLALFAGLFCCQNAANRISHPEIRGVSFVGPSRAIDTLATRTIEEVGANWACLMPFAYGSEGSDSLIRTFEWQWWGEKLEGVEECIKMFQSQGKHIMIKPQIWIMRGSFTGDFELNSKEEWNRWSRLYEDFILEYAALAEKYNVEILCIGTELKIFVRENPKFWTNLIRSVRKRYRGKVTYAANWDNFQNIPFWGDLDYIGIDAYFPLEISSQAPSVDELINAWTVHKKAINELANKLDKPYLFAEVGYRSVPNNTIKPWETSSKTEVDFAAQSIAYDAMFRSFWEEPKFAGMFLWKWFDYHNQLEGIRYETGFTPQGKPAQDLIELWYTK